MNIQHWMTRKPEVVEPEDSALDALERMTEGGFRHLPVVNKQGAPIGIVSIDDLRAALPFDLGVETPLPESARIVARHYRIAEVMTYLPVTVRSTTSLEDAVTQLEGRRIGCLPVIDRNGVLVGIFTEVDALRALAHLLAGGDDSRALPHPPARNERARVLTQLVSELRAERDRLAEALGESRRGVIRPADQPAARVNALAGSAAALAEGGLAEFAGWRMRELARALDDADTGQLGRCSTCGRDIPVARMHVLPSTRHCLRCARALDRPTATP